MIFKETKKRTLFKTISWRIIAILNSWMVLSFIKEPQSNLIIALIMNLTGFFIFFGFERIWNKIKYGKIQK